MVKAICMVCEDEKLFVNEDETITVIDRYDERNEYGEVVAFCYTVVECEVEHLNHIKLVDNEGKMWIPGDYFEDSLGNYCIDAWKEVEDERI